MRYQSSGIPLPTLDLLQATVPDGFDAKKVAADWLQAFGAQIESKNVDGILALFIDNSYWRDVLAITWDFRTFAGVAKIKPFLEDRLADANLKAFTLKDEFLGFQQPAPDLAWIQLFFNFENDVGLGSGVARLVPTKSGEWKAHSVFTNLEELKGFPEQLGALRNQEPDHGRWAERRRRETAFEGTEPTVLIVGGGHCGLTLAARLKALNVPSLIVEKNERIGDNWRNRYDALCLHDPVWYDHMAYLPFPATWPVYTPALKLADWLESYAKSMELNVWTSANVTSAATDASNIWHVTVKQSNGLDRIFKVKHFVLATGLGVGMKMPVYPGMDEFKGKLLHSTQYKKAADITGQKVVVMGSCNSAFDVAADLYNGGKDVTMLQRGATFVMSTKNAWKVIMGGVYSEVAPPTHIADLMNASLPVALQENIHQRYVQVLQQADKEVLDGLRNRGFKLSLGIKDAGLILLAWDRSGGYYLDVGGAQLIVDGKVKLKNDSLVERFTETGLRFEDGSEISADAIICATGLEKPNDVVRRVCGDEIADRTKQIWGLTAEGEISGSWNDLGVPGMWYMLGNLALTRFYSKHVALQIKAQEEGLLGTRYSSP